MVIIDRPTNDGVMHLVFRFPPKAGSKTIYTWAEIVSKHHDWSFSFEPPRHKLWTRPLESKQGCLYYGMRNPFTRMTTIFRFSHMDSFQKYLDQITLQRWVDARHMLYTERGQKLPDTRHWTWATLPCSEWAKTDYSFMISPLHIEHLERDISLSRHLRGPLAKHKIPHENKMHAANLNNDRPWYEWYTPKDVQRVVEMYSADFAAGGYSTKLEDAIKEKEAIQETA